MNVNYYALLEMLRLIKFLYDLGQFERICGGVDSVSEDDYYEIMLLCLEHIAPIFDRDQICSGEDGKPAYFSETDDDEVYGDHWHDLYLFSSPDMREYYRLCRLYEYQHGIQPEDNPYVKAADYHYSSCLRHVSGSFFASFDSDRYATKLWIEICPEDYGPEPDLIYCVHNTLEYYGEHLNELRLELLKGPLVCLPALPAPKGDDGSV